MGGSDSEDENVGDAKGYNIPESCGGRWGWGGVRLDHCEQL
jgi:hypothetical protein